MRRVLVLALMALSLTGCAAIPLMYGASAGMLAVDGLGIFKTVQATTGGSVEVRFAPASTSKPLPFAKRVAVWPGSEAEVRFAERLTASGKYAVTPPATVDSMLQKTHTPFDLGQLTESEQRAAFQAVCRGASAEQVFAAHVGDQNSKMNLYSTSRSEHTAMVDLLTYGCKENAIVWRDQLTLVMKVGPSMPGKSEMLRIGGDAWADRVLGTSPGTLASNN